MNVNMRANFVPPSIEYNSFVPYKLDKDSLFIRINI